MRKLWIVLITVLVVVGGVSAPRVVSVSASNHNDVATAKKCKHCGEWLEPSPILPQPDRTDRFNNAPNRLPY